MQNIHKYALIGLVILSLSACTHEKNRAADLMTLATPKIDSYPDGNFEFDRLLMIPYKDGQPCTEDITPMARINPVSNTIEICLRNQWQTAYVGVTQWAKDAPVNKKPAKKKAKKK